MLRPALVVGALLVLTACGGAPAAPASSPVPVPPSVPQVGPTPTVELNIPASLPLGVTGEPVWTALGKLSEDASPRLPWVWPDLVAVYDSPWLKGLSPDDGRELWRLDVDAVAGREPGAMDGLGVRVSRADDWLVVTWMVPTEEGRVRYALVDKSGKMGETRIIEGIENLRMINANMLYGQDFATPTTKTVSFDADGNLIEHDHKPFGHSLPDAAVDSDRHQNALYRLSSTRYLRLKDRKTYQMLDGDRKPFGEPVDCNRQLTFDNPVYSPNLTKAAVGGAVFDLATGQIMCLAPGPGSKIYKKLDDDDIDLLMITAVGDDGSTAGVLHVANYKWGRGTWWAGPDGLVHYETNNDEDIFVLLENRALLVADVSGSGKQGVVAFERTK